VKEFAELVKNFFPTKLTPQIYAIIMKLSKDTFISTYLFKWCWRFVYDHY